MADNVPSNWYQYDFPLADNPKEPVPSNANYDPHNLAWMIEMFASVLGQDSSTIKFIYENNTPNNRSDDITVEHPGDGLYLGEKASNKTKSQEQLRYETVAKRSVRLKLFQDNSPAGIEYFQPSATA